MPQVEDSKYGVRESARFKGPALKSLNEACELFDAGKSDILRSGPAAAIIIKNIQPKISTAKSRLLTAQAELLAAQSELSEIEETFRTFVSNTLHADASSNPLSENRPTNHAGIADRRGVFVRQVAQERRIA